VLYIPLAEAVADTSIGADISSITAESYSNPGVLLSQEFAKNNQVYLSLSSEGQLEAFFMVGWSEINLHGAPIDCVFLGLSAVTAKRKGSGIVLTVAFFTMRRKLQTRAIGQLHGGFIQQVRLLRA
jgi:hypothetical protein